MGLTDVIAIAISRDPKHVNSVSECQNRNVCLGPSVLYLPRVSSEVCNSITLILSTRVAMFSATIPGRHGKHPHCTASTASITTLNTGACDKL